MTRHSAPLLPYLTPGADYWTVLRNLSRLLRCGFSMNASRDIVLAEAGLTAFPRPARTTSYTIH